MRRKGEKKTPNNLFCLLARSAAYVYTVKHTRTRTNLDNGVQVGKAAVTAGCWLGVASAGAIVRTSAPPLIIERRVREKRRGYKMEGVVFVAFSRPIRKDGPTAVGMTTL